MAMGLLIGGLTTAAIDRVVALARTHTEDYFKWWKGVKEELRWLKMLLTQIQYVIDATEMREQHISDPLREWLRQLKDALYEANSTLDELDHLQLKQQSRAIKLARCIFIPDPKLNKLGRAVKKFGEVASGVVDFVVLVSNVQREFQQQEIQTIIKCEIGPLLTENKVFGREEERDELLRWLTMMHVVYEGIGKTTLAQLMFNDKIVQDSFNLKI